MCATEGAYRLFYRALLQKRPAILRVLIIATSLSLYVLQKRIFSSIFPFCSTYSAKEPYKRDDILQKIPIILRSLLIVATSLALYVLQKGNIELTVENFCARKLACLFRDRIIVSTPVRAAGKDSPKKILWWFCMVDVVGVQTFENLY